MATAQPPSSSPDDAVGVDADLVEGDLGELVGAVRLAIGRDLDAGRAGGRR